MSHATKWNFNPRASTANVVVYDGNATTTTYADSSIGYGSATTHYGGTTTGTGRHYDISTQPYDGYASGQNPYSWKTPTAWEPIAGSLDF